jgi:hypothetical protein
MVKLKGAIMHIIRQYIAPVLAIIIFLIALVAVSARIFLPTDLLAPAPVGFIGMVLNLLLFR